MVYAFFQVIYPLFNGDEAVSVGEGEGDGRQARV